MKENEELLGIESLKMSKILNGKNQEVISEE